MKKSKLVVILFSFFLVNLSQLISEEDCHLYPATVLAGAFTLPGIQSVPPINDSMSFDCIFGYKMMDSLAKILPDSTIQHSQYNMSLDSLLVALRYRYCVQDYSPYLMRSYMMNSEKLVENNYYKSYISSNYYNLAFVVQRKIEEIGYANSLLYLSDYILRINVTCVENVLDSTTYEGAPPEPWTNVQSDVVAIIKGQNLPGNCQTITTTNYKTDSIYSNVILNTLTQMCLRFSYIPDWKTNNGFKEYSTLKGGGDHLQQMSKNKEYIVFLSELALDNIHEFLTPLTQIGKNGGIFEITSDNKVIDKDNLFGLGNNPNADDFISKINEKIAEIKSKHYGATSCLNGNLLEDNNIKLNLFPNPVNSVINIQFQLESPKVVDLGIYDLLGNKLISVFSNKYLEQNYFTCDIDISQLPSGTYRIIYRSGDQLISKLFIITR